MRILGAVLAGGQSKRFGSDKAEAVVGGTRLIDLVAKALSPQAEALVICGRDDPAFTCIPDHPEAGLGPLGGLNAALHHATAQGFDAVLCASCDAPNLPADLLTHLKGDGPAIVQSQPVIGFWPSELATKLDAFLEGGGRALYGFSDSVGARLVRFHPPIANINRPEDLGDAPK